MRACFYLSVGFGIAMVAGCFADSEAPKMEAPSAKYCVSSVLVTPQCCPDIFKTTPLTCDIYGEFLYLQPNGTDLYYGAYANGVNSSDPFPSSVISPDWKILIVNPGYHPGFEVGLNFILNQANLEIDLNWERLFGRNSDSYNAPAAAGNMVGPFFDIGPNSASYKVAKGHATFHFDAANMTFARNVCFFEDFHTRFYGSASFARILQRLHSSYRNSADTISRSVKNKSTFIGAGPQVGVDYDYRIYRKFFFSGNSVISLFMGQMKNKLSYQSYTPELNLVGYHQPNNQKATIPNRTQLVPGLDQKLGFSLLGIWKSISVDFQIGYRCQIYLNAIQNFNISSQAVPVDLTETPDVGVFAVAFDQTNSNFILTGPYATLGLKF